MRIVILSGSPKPPGVGLCQSLIAQAQAGIREAGAEVITLGFSALTRCRVCGEGWGTCLNDNTCAFGGDGFDQARETVLGADGFVLLTPVYFGEASESLKAFLDRLRRCEFSYDSPLTGKQALLIASAGGSGKGLVNCLGQLERYGMNIRLKVFDMVGVNRWNQAYKRQAVFEAAKALALAVMENRAG